MGLFAVASSALSGCGNASGTLQGGDPLMADPCQPGGANGGNRWQDLYACYFGPTGVVSCEGMADCHGAADQTGSKASLFVCNPGADPAPCWQSMTSALVMTKILLPVLCKSGGGLMPKNCPHRLEPGDLARITAWIQAGALNN